MRIGGSCVRISLDRKSDLYPGCGSAETHTTRTRKKIYANHVLDIPS
jgi:hypothetical protein